MVEGGRVERIGIRLVKLLDLGIVDWTLAGIVVATRALDRTSTEECLRRPSQQCHKGELPTLLVKNRAGFGAFGAGGDWSHYLAQYEMTRHGHRKAGAAWADH